MKWDKLIMSDKSAVYSGAMAALAGIGMFSAGLHPHYGSSSSISGLGWTGLGVSIGG
jgi:ABC-type uncharacterized transport system permease subunit